MRVCICSLLQESRRVIVEHAHPDLTEPMHFVQAKSAAIKGASTAPSWRTSHHRSSCTSVVMGSIEDGNRPVFACISNRSSFSFHRSINHAWKSSRVSRGMEDSLKRRQCMWIGAWGCRSKYVERSVKMSWPYCPSLVPYSIPVALQGVWKGKGVGFLEGRMSDSRNAVVGQSTVVHPIQRPIQRFQTKVRPCTPWDERVLEILLTLSLGPLDTLGSPVLTQIGAFGKHHQPHWLQHSLTIIAPSGQLTESTGQARAVGFHVPRHEYETGKAQTETYEGNVQNRFFEDDVDMAVVEGAVSISCPPEVDPVIV